MKTLLFNLILLLAAALPAPAQSVIRERSQIKDFGASLRPGYVKPTLAPKASKTNADNEVIRITTDLVVTDVLVINEKGFTVDGLKKDDFTVSEDNAPQAIDTFSQGDGGRVPRSIVLIMDYSGSMLPFLRTSVAAAKVLVDQLKPNDRMALVTDDVELLTGFTRDRNLLKAKLDDLERNAGRGKFGRSEQYSALMAALNELFDEEDVRPIVIFQTDGDEFGALKGNYVPPAANVRAKTVIPFQERPFSYQDVVTAAERARATIYTIIPGTQYIGIPENEQLKRARADLTERIQNNSQFYSPNVRPNLPDKILAAQVRWMLHIHQPIVNLAKLSGGWADQVEKPEQAGAIYLRVLTDINMRYLIGYYPTNEARDGKRRLVSIEVKNHPEYKIFARRSYYAPEN